MTGLELLSTAVSAADYLEKLSKLVKIGVDQVRDRRLTYMLVNLAVDLGAGDLVAGEKRLHEFLLEHAWAGDLLHRAYRSLMDAVCDEASVPLAALVSEYLVRTNAPDRRYRRVGAFVADATHEDLEIARRLTASIIAVADAAPEHNPIRVGLNAKLLRVFAWIGWITPEDEEAHELRGDDYAGKPGVIDVVQMLARHGFASFENGSSMTFGVEDAWDADQKIEIQRGEHLESIRLLARCLSLRPVPDAVVEASDESGSTRFG